MVVPILLVLAALMLLVLEVFVVSLGALSIAAAALGICGILLGFQESSVFGWSLVATVVALGPTAVWGAFKVLPHFKFTRGFYLRRPQITEKERRAAVADHTALEGAVGRSLSALRPSGSARFGEDVVSVVSGGEMIPRGTRVQVVEISGNRVVVSAAPDTENAG
ncbi:MAG: NfeD family protein [Planctomycetota bacterium]